MRSCKRVSIVVLMCLPACNCETFWSKWGAIWGKGYGFCGNASANDNLKVKESITLFSKSFASNLFLFWINWNMN